MSYTRKIIQIAAIPGYTSEHGKVSEVVYALTNANEIFAFGNEFEGGPRFWQPLPPLPSPGAGSPGYILSGMDGKEVARYDDKGYPIDAAARPDPKPYNHAERWAHRLAEGIKDGWYAGDIAVGMRFWWRNIEKIVVTAVSEEFDGSDGRWITTIGTVNKVEARNPEDAFREAVTPL